MLVKGIIDEDFINYKKPSMLIAFPYCDLKCDKECGRAVCQNSPLLKEPNIDISYDTICERYLNNPITEAIVLQGMEVFDSLYDMYLLIGTLRIKYGCLDDVVIYTGYTKEEVNQFSLNGYKIGTGEDKSYIGKVKIIPMLKKLGHIIIKYGRYIPDQEPHYDEVLGVNLASNNQYAERL